MQKKLPLILMSAMVVIALMMEQFAFGRIQSVTKIPIVLLLALAFILSKRRHDAAVR